MEPSDVRRSVLPYVVMIAFVALPPGLLALVGVFGSDSVPEGRCEGLGWGCTLSPADTARLLLLFVLPLALLWAAGSALVLALLRRRPAYRNRPVIVQGLLPAAPVLVVLIVCALLLMGR